MKIRQRHSAPVLVAVMVIALTACVGEADIPAAVPTATETAVPTPVFASEEEALAAAVSTLTSSLAQSSEIMSQGGKDPDRIGRFFTPDLASAEIAGYAEMARLRQRSEGSLTVTNALLQSYDEGAVEGQAIVRLYACISVAGTRLIGGDGDPVDLSHRPDTATFELTFSLEADFQPPLVISEKAIWQGQSIC